MTFQAGWPVNVHYPNGTSFHGRVITPMGDYGAYVKMAGRPEVFFTADRLDFDVSGWPVGKPLPEGVK